MPDILQTNQLTKKNKTMNLMFSYPIKRQKILASQMIAALSVFHAETKDLL